MLLELRIENLLLIERAELRLGPGLNAITGETGAGKTVLAHSLDLLMGGKARSGIVRPGADEAYVEGVFEIPEGLFDDPDLAELAERLPEGEDEIVVGRRVFTSGRTSAFVQGRSASAADLKILGSKLLAFYGQHEHRKLTLSSAQMEILDGFAGPDLLDLRERYRAAHRDVTELEARLAALRSSEGERERDIDLLRFELGEIEAVGSNLDNYDELVAERDRLRHLEALTAAGAAAVEAIDGRDDAGAAGLLATAKGVLDGVAGVDSRLDAIAERLDSALIELEDVAGEARRYVDELADGTGDIESAEEAVAAVDRLLRKHGGTVEAVAAHRDHCVARLAELEGAEESTAEVEKSLANARQLRHELADRLSAGRREAAERLSEIVAGELAGLAMDGARLEVRLEPLPDGFGPGGAESVELLVATNPGMPPSPLRDAASGGELSRVMLALTIASRGAGGATLVFDEIDAGIGGNTGRLVGEKLRELAGHGQVLCITHLPQIAALAANHFKVEKHAEGGSTIATVERISGDDLVAEIVRMLGAGDSSAEAAEAHARDLLAAAA